MILNNELKQIQDPKSKGNTSVDLHKKEDIPIIILDK